MKLKNASVIGPILTSSAALILVFLILFSGSRPNFLSEYDLVTFNTTGLGENIFLKLIAQASSSDDDNKDDSSLCDKLGPLAKDCKDAAAVVSSVTDEVTDKINDFANGVFDRAAEGLGIADFYSLHPMTLCEGNFKANTTDGRNVTECHEAFTKGYNILEAVERDISLGPFNSTKITLADLLIPETAQKAVSQLSTTLKAFTGFMIVGLGFTGLSLIGSLAAMFFLPRSEAKVFRANTYLSGLAAATLGVSGLVGTIAATIVESKVNDSASGIGLTAKMGVNYVILAWVSFGLAIISFGYWLWRDRKLTHARKQAVHNVKGGRDSLESGEKWRA